MGHSFASSFEKVKRADQQIIQLNREIDLFLDEPPYGAYRVAHDIDFQAFQQIQESLDGHPLPLRFSVICGEIVHDLRSSLDHLAWQLVIAAKNEPSRKTCFPIFISDPRSDKDALTRYEGCVKGMSVRAKALIHQLQPFERSSTFPEGDPLAILNALCNRDKHRELNVVCKTFSFSIKSFRFSGIPKDSTDGHSLTITEDINVDVHDKFTIGVAFTDAQEALVATLAKLSEETREVLAVFRRLFPD
jgi:hypothetical protein